MLTEIWQIDDNGNISELACYTLEPKKALIVFRQQNEFKNFNTWNYPKEDPAIKQLKNGEFVYFTGENTSIYTKTIRH